MMKKERMMKMSTNPQTNSMVYVEHQLLKEMPLGTPLVAKGFVEKNIKDEAHIHLTLTINHDVVRVFIDAKHPHFTWWRDQAPTRFYGNLLFTLTKPFEPRYGSFTGRLHEFSYETYEEPTVVKNRGLKTQLKAHLASLKNPALQALWRTFLNNKEMCARFFFSPASLDHAYSFKGGLATHTVLLMDWIEGQVAAAVPRYYEAYLPSPMNQDLLKTAALFHDTGKMFAYHLEEGKVSETDEGHLLGKVALSLQFLQDTYQEMIKEHPEFTLSSFEYLELQHIIASANREREFGAIVVPKTKEAIYFAHLESLETAVGHYHDLERKQVEPGFTRLFHRTVYVSPYHGDYSEVLPNPVTPVASESIVVSETPQVPLVSTEEVVIAEAGTELLTYETSDYEEDTTYVPPIEETSVLPTESLLSPIQAVAPEFVQITEPSPVMSDSLSEPLSFATPFVGQETTDVSQDTVHPTFMSPVMNIPAEWPQTPSTAPVLSNGMPIQPIMPIQQPIDLTSPSPILPAMETEGDSFLSEPLPDLTMDLPPLPTLVPFSTPESVTSVEEEPTADFAEPNEVDVVEETSKPKTTKKSTARKTTPSKTTKSTKTTKTDSDEVKAPKSTKKSTKSTKAKEEESTPTLD